MAGSIVIINDSAEHTWYVGDRDLPELIRHLDRIGMRDRTGNELSSERKGPSEPLPTQRDGRADETQAE